MNKKYQGLLDSHERSHKYDLWDCYGHFSYWKARAYDNCKQLCEKLNGYDFKIIGYNTCMFSIGFYYRKGNQLMFHYESNKTILDFEVK